MILTPGQRISTRGEDFIITNANTNHDGSWLIEAEGISELVKGKRFCFDSALDTDIRPIDPLQTRLRPDTDTGYRKTKLFLETQIRNAPVSSLKITIADKAAINPAEYQLTPVLKALQLPRPRLLIADGVGLGKTIEVGIFLSELIKRGIGKRIMILAPKAILAQFQQELWHRFAIPLVRLDSEGILKIKSQLPSNKNPFEFYDKTIISIDTLKNNAKFRHYLEKSRWDVVVIDECHTVANDKSQRGDLAQLIAKKCDALILTSATPHNGRKENFANLIHMIEPIAIPRDGDYTKDHVEPYYVRRFKKDLLDEEVLANFKDREVIRDAVNLSAMEIDFLRFQQDLKFKAIQKAKAEKDGTRKPKEDFLFAIGIFKAFMSSPVAARESIIRRMEKISSRAQDDETQGTDLTTLQELKTKLDAILQNQSDSKYKKLREKLLMLGWTGRLHDDRYVIFAERIDTLEYLRDNLVADFNLQEGTYQFFHGGLTDVEQQEIIEDFGKEDSKVRVLLCSDAGSQGVNLHFFCNRMFNYDIPWSLITLEQRNGRIDRYGQDKTPFIHYLIAESDIDGLKTDLHIIERLTQKEQTVYETLGDAGSVMKLYDPNKEENLVTRAMYKQDEAFMDHLEKDDEHDYSTLFGDLDDTTPALITHDPYETKLTIYPDEGKFYTDLFDQLLASRQVQNNEVTAQPGYLEILNTRDLNKILYDLPPESKPDVGQLFKLSMDKKLVQQSIEKARKKKGTWAEFQVLYELHPVIRYFMTKLEASVDKDVALVAKTHKLPPNTAWYVFHAQVSNNIGQPVLADFLVTGIRHDGSVYHTPYPLHTFIDEFHLDEQLHTQSCRDSELSMLQQHLATAVKETASAMHQKQIQLEQDFRQKLDVYEAKLQAWRSAAIEQLDLFTHETYGHLWTHIRDKREREIETILSSSSQYYKNLTSLQGDAYLKVLAVFYH
jgi:SNF2 family DNA or RNA helicase